MTRSRSRSRRITCVGGGPAGLYFAIMTKLRESGDEVTVLERDAVGETHGWGVGWNGLVDDVRGHDPATARALLAASFPWVDSQVVEVSAGRAGVGFPGTLQRSRMPSRPGYGIARDRLLDVLRDRALELGVRVENGVTVCAGEPPDADVVVAADGAGSGLRQRHAEVLRPQVAAGRNVYTWLATPHVIDAMTWGFVSTPVGWIWCHAYAYSRDRSTFIVECAPETREALGLTGRSTRTSLSLLGRLFAGQLAGRPLLSHSAPGDPLPWAASRTLTADRWHAGNVVLLGDAAHTTHFSIGSGTRLAMLDAVGLADALHRYADVPTALASYERERRAALVRPQQDARLSQAWFEQVARFATPDAVRLHTSLRHRRLAVVHRLPPGVHYPLARAAARVPITRTLYHAATDRLGHLGDPGRRQ